MKKFVLIVFVLAALVLSSSYLFYRVPATEIITPAESAAPAPSATPRAIPSPTPAANGKTAPTPVPTEHAAQPAWLGTAQTGTPQLRAFCTMPRPPLQIRQEAFFRIFR